ncbi:TetR/AcrR family transcriptional regulator [Rhizobium subbaraonis]|nr:TetR/AcrR family transcriptional regulator [Rhizobium subbaraonis]
MAVHKAVRELMVERPESELTVAMIAARAEVTPSTIYRRWSSLSQLIADVASERFVPDSIPPDTGSLRGDLEVWVEQTVEDFSSAPLRLLFRERLTNKKIAQVAAGYTYMNLLYLCDRCERRGEPTPNPDRLIDLIFAPLVYRIFFVNQSIPKSFQIELVQMALASPLLATPVDEEISIGQHTLFENDPQ